MKVSRDKVVLEGGTVVWGVDVLSRVEGDLEQSHRFQGGTDVVKNETSCEDTHVEKRHALLVPRVMSSKDQYL